MPSAVAGPKPPLPRRSSDRSTVPRTALLASVPPSIVVVDEPVTDEATVVLPIEVDVLPGGGTVELVGGVGNAAAVVIGVTGMAALAVVAVGPCEATPAGVGGGAVGGGVATGAAVVAGWVTGGVVVGTGEALGGLPQSAALNGLGGWPSIGGGG
jgi:hypothetical protein